MVLKGYLARKEKKLKLKGRPERSLFVQLKKRPEKREEFVKILEAACDDIERVFLPRQKRPKSVFVLCKEGTDRKKVKKVLSKLDNKDLGGLYVRLAKPKKEKEELSLSKPKLEIDKKTLILEWIPAELETSVIEEAFPEAKVDRFNKRRCYIHFRNAKDAMKARVRLAKDEIGGYKLKAKFNKVVVVKTESEEAPSASENEEKDNEEDITVKDDQDSDSD